jgi:circadian clock protein KaiC
MVIGGSAARTDVDVSYLADTVLLFRYFEAEGEIRGALGVFKKRDGGHERSLRRLEVTSTGIEVGEPLRAFRGIMTGVPQYDARTDSIARARGDET